MNGNQDPLRIMPKSSHDPLGILSKSDDPLGILPQPSRAEQLRAGGELEWEKPPEPGLEEPWVPNPFEMIGAVGAAGTKLGMGLGRAALSGVIAAGAEYPIGMATEEIEPKHPRLALPFNIITGMLSGITIERAVEKGIVRVLTKQGLKPPQKNINLLKSRVTNQLKAGTAGDDLTQAAAEELNRAAEKPETGFLREEFKGRFAEVAPEAPKAKVKVPEIQPEIPEKPIMGRPAPEVALEIAPEKPITPEPKGEVPRELPKAKDIILPGEKAKPTKIEMEVKTLDLEGKEGRAWVEAPEVKPPAKESAIDLEQLKKHPSLSDYVLKRKPIHAPEVISEAQKIKEPPIAKTIQEMHEIAEGLPKPRKVEEFPAGPMKMKEKAGMKLYGGLPFDEIPELWTKTIGGPLWDTVITKKLPKLLEKIPGGKAVNRAMLYEYRGNLPNTPGYIKSLEDMRRYQAIGRDYAIDLGKRLQSTSEEAQIRMGEYIRGEIEKLPNWERALADEAKRTFYDLGKQAVELDLLSEQVFFKNAGRYMPRLYTSKEYGRLLTAYRLKKPMRMDLSRFKRRKDIPKEIREAMGEILTPGYPVAKGISQLTHDIEMAKFFKGIADNPLWAAAKKAEIIPEGFKQLPSNKKLGPLSEAHVHHEIYQDIQETVRIMETPEKVWRQLLGVWKIGKIVNPKTMARNLFGGNVILSHLGGFPLWRQPRSYAKALNEMRLQGKYYLDARKEGLLKTTWTKGELKQLFDIEAELATLKKPSIAEGLGVMGRTWEKILVLSQKGGKAYQALEEWSKLAHMIDAVEKRGMSIPEAAKDSQKWLFDYGKVTKFQEKYRTKWYGAPFATFTFKALPRIAEATIKTPWRMAAPAALIYGIEKAAQIKIGDTKEEIRAKKELRPDWQKGNFLGIPNFARVPLIDDYGREHYWNLTYWLPWGDIGEGGGFGPIPGSLVPMSQPFVKEAFQQIVNYDTFWKKPIVGEEELAGKSGIAKYLTEAQIRAKHLGQTLAPTMAIDITKGVAAIRGKPDIRGRERHPLAVALDVFGGIKLYPVDYADQMQKQISKYDPQKGFLARKIKYQINTYEKKRKANADKGKGTDFYDRKIAEKIKQLQGLGKEVEQKGETYKKAKVQ